MSCFLFFFFSGVSKGERKHFNQLRSMGGIIQYFERRNLWNRDLHHNNILQTWDIKWNKWSAPVANI